MESSAVEAQQDWLVNGIAGHGITSPIALVGVIVSSRCPRGLWERLRPRTSNKSRRTGSHIDHGLSFDERLANPFRKVFGAHREENRPSIRRVRDRVNNYSLVLNHLHLVGSVLEIGLGHQ